MKTVHSKTFANGTQLELRADWSEASDAIWYRWSQQIQVGGPWQPATDWNITCYQVSDFRHDWDAALKEIAAEEN